MIRMARMVGTNIKVTYRSNKAAHGDAYAEAMFFLGTDVENLFFPKSLAARTLALVMHDRALTGYPRNVPSKI